ncbi:hypothetical protein Bealeia1_01957 (plasmid) [Candidatus Bealeia paramacronuclearis]|uniref:Uncharacterized protein n=1 Tax=Candidatus Bealeia paramacronuclearis TaxID=1921001 RepID=A0ABZ2C9I9_9PROT
MTNLSLRQNGEHFNTLNSESVTRHLDDVIAELKSIRRTNTGLLRDLSRTLHQLEALRTPRVLNEIPSRRVA